jgi:hypothetical protein
MFHTYHKALVVAGLVFCSLSSAFAYSGGSGTPEEPYRIANKEDLLTLAGTVADYDKCFILTADIDLDPNLPGGQVFTTAIIAADTSSSSGFQGTTFTGTFNGNGHKITNFTINGGSNSYLGLFGKIGTGGSVKNLGLENVSITSGNNSYHLGGMVGYNMFGSISNCYSTGAVSGFYAAGGLVGYNDNNGSISDCYSTGSVSGYSGVGGLVGVNRSGISNCYSTGAVSGDNGVGGLAGYNDGSISGCYFLITIGPDNGYGEPLTDEQMKQQNSFAGWDFTNETANGTNDYWRMCVNDLYYPHLSWEYSSYGDFVCPDGVNIEDLDYFVQRWLLGDCASSNNCDGTDMNTDGTVNFIDFALFAQNWLEM